MFSYRSLRNLYFRKKKFVVDLPQQRVGRVNVLIFCVVWTKFFMNKFCAVSSNRVVQHANYLTLTLSVFTYWLSFFQKQCFHVCSSGPDRFSMKITRWTIFSVEFILLVFPTCKAKVTLKQHCLTYMIES